MRKRKRLSAILAIALIVSLLPTFGITALAQPEYENSIAAYGEAASEEYDTPAIYLAVYTTTTHFYTINMVASNNLANSRIHQEAESVYFAVSTDGVNFDVLNWGGGVIFAPARLSSYQGVLSAVNGGLPSGAAQADPFNLTNANFNSGNPPNVNRIREPLIYYDPIRWPDEPFRVVAYDMNPVVGYYEFTSADGVFYYNARRIPLREDVEAIYDLDIPRLSKDDITLMFNGDDLTVTDPNITLGNAIEISAETHQFVLNKLAPVFNTGLDPIGDVGVTVGEAFTEESLQDLIPDVIAHYSDGSYKPFRINWSGALDGIDFSQPGTHEVTGEVIQIRYLNRLRELNGSLLPEDDPDNRNPDFPANVDPATGRVFFDETKFVEGLADPQIFWDEPTGYYYMTGSYFPQLGIDEMPGEVLHGMDNQYDRVAIRRSRTLAGLQRRIPPADVMDPEAIGQVVVWITGNQRYYNNPMDRQMNPEGRVGRRNIWAPQMHRMAYEGPCLDPEACDAAFYEDGGLTPCNAGWWVVYVTQNVNLTGGFTSGIVSHALVLPGHRDPFESALRSADQPSEWINYRVLHDIHTNERGEMRNLLQLQQEYPRHYHSLIIPFNLDLDFFTNVVTGKSYLCWTGKPMYLGNGNTDIFMAEMDPKVPWEITSHDTRLTFPDFGWERISFQVNEGTTTLQRDGMIYKTFSGSGTGSEYAIGMLIADASADLLAYAEGTTDPTGKNGMPAAWTKSPFPILSSRHVDGEEGPGHNSFSVDEYGNDIFVYHARPTSHNYGLCGGAGNPLGDPCRHARIKRVHWGADGIPIINMTYDDELRPENRTVTTTITVSLMMYNIIATANPVTGGTVTGAGIFDDGATVTLTATASANYDFVGWYEDGERIQDASEVYEFIVGADRTLEARFVRQPPGRIPQPRLTREDEADIADPDPPGEAEPPDVDPDRELFYDVMDPETWYYDAVYFVTDAGLMDGVGGNMFSPGTPLTRAMFVTILGRLAEQQGEVTTGFSNPFADVSAGQWYTQYVAWASSNGIVLGLSDTVFAPNDPVTREQMAALMIRFCDFMEIELRDNIDIGFADADVISGWAKEFVERAAAAGLMQGSEGHFRPLATSTRAEVAQLFMNFMQVYIE